MNNWNSNRREKFNPSGFLNDLNFNAHYKEWIADGANAEMVQTVESIGNELEKQGLSSSQIRNVYGEIKRIQMGGFDKNKSSFYLLKPKVAYAYGRSIKARGESGMELFKAVFDKLSTEVHDKNSFDNFAAFFEAVIAYHKAAGGK